MSTQWTSFLWLFVVASLQIYILYVSIYRYINLKSEVFNGFKDHKWISSLLNFQLFVIISSLGLLPLWMYSTLFSSPSFFCGHGERINKRGFYQLVWNEALHILPQHIPLELSVIRREQSKCCLGNIRIALFYPVANLLHVLMAYLLTTPLPFIEASFVLTNDERQESLDHNDLEFLGLNNVIVKIKCSIEYFNLSLSLLALSFQFTKVLWSCNKLFSIFLNSIQILVTIHILLQISLFSIFTKFYYKPVLPNTLFLSPCFIMLIMSVSDALLVLSSFSYFQFGFEKCVQSLLMSSWFNNINRADTIPLTNNYEQSNCQSTTSSSIFYSSRSVGERKNSLCPHISAAGLFIVAMGLKIISCYEYWPYVRVVGLFIVYATEWLVLVLAYVFVWFGMCLKSNWLFKLTEKQLTHYAIITYPEKVESNYYKSLGSKQGNSQMSLSVASNTNGSVQSKKKEQIFRAEYTNHNQYITNCMSLNFPPLNKLSTEPSEYLQLNNHLSKPDGYKIISPINTLTGVRSPTITNFIYRDFPRTMTTPNYKYTTSPYSILRSNGSALSDESDDVTRKTNTNYPIQEEINNETDFSSGDEEVFLDSAQPLLKYNEQLKFVTFQLDKMPEMSTDLCSSNDNLTIESLDTSEKFMKELENENGTKGTVKSLYVLESSVTNVGRPRHLDSSF